ncbi:hypothetical protein [Shewanella nanhaiensis]|uniref:Cthe-2314-like HEPN domain-containing protein n=1 Tax=Shewanella nanhaiensis TaxID=2864872 RepID=A0ABS7E1I5_9GAMM|nr:hypothetical protein [Shewanella nanhaiensis]MBW8183564.1 hypothetical protein [Shewanella nanhaiensis]
MDQHTTTRVPVNDEYAALVGKAVYVFAYYEWTIIYIIEYLENGFVSDYSRGKPMTSGAVLSKLKQVIKSLSSLPNNVTQSELDRCTDNFARLIVKRNALIHAHPCTDDDGSQILSYQASPTKPLPDMKWPKDEVEKIIAEIDEVACESKETLEKLR